MLPIDSIRADLGEIVADLPVTCSYKGTSFTATSSDFGLGRSVEIDGELHDVDRTIVADSADVPEGLRAPDTITVDGEVYRVERVSEHQDGVGLEIDLKAIER